MRMSIYYKINADLYYNMLKIIKEREDRMR